MAGCDPVGKPGQVPAAYSLPYRTRTGMVRLLSGRPYRNISHYRRLFGKKGMSRVVRQVCELVFLFCIANITVFLMIIGMIGGCACSGKIEDGRYYVGNRGKYTEVSAAVYRYSLYHSYSVMVTHPLGFAAMGLSNLVKKLEAKKNKPIPTSTPIPEGPTLHISYQEGAPGSIFTLSGLAFPPDQAQSVWVNGHLMTVMAPNPGQYETWFIFHLDTQQADEGKYSVMVQTQSVTRLARFLLDANEPVREPIRGSVFDRAPVFSVPPGIAFSHRLFLPLIMK